MPETLKNRRQQTLNAACSIRRTFVMNNIHGLHARPAALLIKQVSLFECEVTVECGGEIANARSMLGLLSLAAGTQSKLTFTARGPDALQALEAIRHLFETQFAEAY